MKARIIKPGFFVNDTLAGCDPLARILFAGLWCVADREGKVEWSPKRLQTQILPYDNVNIYELAKQLEESGFICTFLHNRTPYIKILRFEAHQKIHLRERASEIPEPNSETLTTLDDIGIFPNNGDLPLFPNGCPNTGKGSAKASPAQSLNISKPITSTYSSSPNNQGCLIIKKEVNSSKLVDGWLAVVLAPFQIASDLLDPPFLRIPLVHRGEEFVVRESLVRELADTYQGVDVRYQLKRLKRWNESNPTRRKTKRGIQKHIDIWMSKQQDIGRVQTIRPKTSLVVDEEKNEQMREYMRKYHGGV